MLSRRHQDANGFIERKVQGYRVIRKRYAGERVGSLTRIGVPYSKKHISTKEIDRCAIPQTLPSN
jgi:hypothetical protein